MQDRYVGDVGDFAKYALLRSIVSHRSIRLGIIWCLFRDESHNADGRHTSYLRRPEFRRLDPDLHDRLALIVSSDHRSVQKICTAGIFPSGTISCDLPVSASSQVGVERAAREAHRAKWLATALAITTKCNVVFLDPDNGLQVPSVPRHYPKAGKYIFWDELRSFWERGQSLIVYHHLNRRASVRDQTKAIKRKFKEKFPDASMIAYLLFRRGSCRHFWIVGQVQHASILQSKIEALLDSGWSEYFEVG